MVIWIFLTGLALWAFGTLLNWLITLYQTLKDEREEAASRARQEYYFRMWLREASPDQIHSWMYNNQRIREAALAEAVSTPSTNPEKETK